MKIKFTLVTILAFFVLLPSFTTVAEEVYDIEDYADAMQPGWNLGNTFDALGADETGWGNPRVTRELIQSIAAAGYNSIRLPITFDQRMDGAPDYTIDADFLARYTQAVDWALEADMKVMINIHHDSWVWLENQMVTDQAEALARFEAIWEQLTAHFADHSIDVMFESINEPRFNTDEEHAQELLDLLNDRFYDIVRDSGGTNAIRPLIIPTMDTSSDQEDVEPLVAWIDKIDDPYLIATVHYYSYWPFSVNIAGVTEFDQESIDHMHEQLGRVHSAFTENGIPVVVGEFGLLGFDTHVDTVQQGEKLKFFEYAIHYMQENDLVHMLWDNGQHFNRLNYTWYDQDFYNIMRAGFDGRSATAERDFIYFRQSETIADRELALNLHGLALEEISYNGTTLVDGTDYTVSSDAVLFSASFLEQVVDLDQAGVSATVELHFNQGPNWKVNLIVFDTPVTQDNTGHYHDFFIPINFNGDQLATLEAVYDDGTAAGPNDWTTFKEFGRVFSPDYGQNRITFPYDGSTGDSYLFNEIESGVPVTLRLHFWSGEVLEYELIRDGSNITGYAVENDSHEPEQPEEEEEEEEEPETVEQITVDGATVYVSDDFVNETASNSSFVLDLTDLAVTRVSLTADQVAALNEKAATIIIELPNLTIRIPAANLAGAAQIDFELLVDQALPNEQAAESAIYQLTITVDGEIIRSFAEPIELQFTYTGEATPDEHLAVYYWNSDNDSWDKVGGEVDGNYITASTDHFSIFTVFNPNIFLTEDDDLDQDEQEDSVTPTPAPEQSTPGGTGNQHAGISLPNTATSMFNYAIAGVTILLIGAGILLYIKKRQLLN
ncbi:LPXTG-motif cell wall anchor domain-containing protein [Amphibacillus marinus]|uniref:LPXTG-motif cell wall anchor domain-containing protein n=1 Tax=Amphibacillus marinus TaxID=872970 RepID=A0A1H8N950_9BACI|nr:cellulase family glycosylhydrolase [Amphibacillus marinus]SEO26130.1 LPXTG-motif cell wall anchor domain-containing protein [Amphibacillus marinus]